MRLWKSALFIAVLAMSAFASPAFSVDCDADRALFPKNWKAVSAETPLLACRGRYMSAKVFLTPRNEFSAMLTVASDKAVYRAIVDVRDVASLKEQKGLYILYSEKTCFVRGNYASPAVLSFGDGSRSNGLSFLFAADRLDLFEACEPVK